MAHPLAELRDYLLEHSDPGRLLEIADEYLSSKTRMGNDLILPSEYAVLRPILEYYDYNDRGWLRFVGGLRNLLVKTDPRWERVYALYRTLDVRMTQRERRDRLSAAVDAAVAKRLIANDMQEKKRYADRCTKLWIKQRTALLDDARRRTKRGRVTEAERSELLSKFWDDVDQRIAAGDVPEP